MKKKIAILLLAFATALGIGLMVATPASAVPTGCTSGWSAWYANGFNGGGEGNWGKARFCYAHENDLYFWQWQVQDTLTDGYAVHLEACSNYSPYYPHTCTNVGGGYSPFFGDIVTDVAPSDLCPQSVGEVHTTQVFAMASKDPNFDHSQSYLVVRVVKGRCEGGAHQDAGHFDLLLST